ncbi:MAG: YraN family protein [Cyclobacteriaceae bacterium]|jgi:putative endonuclease|nr:YraN family protein [Cyclobacteriaceae bacterium]
MTDKKTKGMKAEEEAANFLRGKGYEIVERNYRHKHAEIDIIATKGNVLVFVEVKSRSSLKFGMPEDFVDDRKAKKVMEGAEAYLIEKNWQGPIRFDVIAIHAGKQNEIEHLEDAFY